MKCEQNSVRWKTEGQRVEPDLTDKRKLTPKPVGFREDVSKPPKSLQGPGTREPAICREERARGNTTQKDGEKTTEEAV